LASTYQLIPQSGGSNWIARVGQSQLDECDQIAWIANESADPKLELKYLKSYVALSVPGSFFNVVPFWPKKSFVPARFNVSEPEKWVQRLTDADLETRVSGGQGKSAVTCVLDF
jgi:hypothetical protein